jgi:protein-tyrosine phosphatase
MSEKIKSPVNNHHISEIIPNKLYLGCESAAKYVPDTPYAHPTSGEPIRITHVLNVANGVRCFYKDSPSVYRTTNDKKMIDYLKIPMLDDEQYNLLQHLDQIFDFIDNGQVVLVHCAMGISRSTACVIAYLMKTRNWTYGEAFNHVKKNRRIICPNRGFKRQLKQWHREQKTNRFLVESQILP